MAILSLKTNTFSRSLLIGNEFYNPFSFNLIETVALSSDQSSITFSSIPSTYAHLQIRYQARTSAAITFATWAYLRFNGDTGANYRYHRLNGRGDGVVYADSSSGNQANGGYTAGGSGLANQFSTGIIDILDYTNTNKNKVTRALSGNDGQSTASDNDIALISSIWLSNNAITSILMFPTSGNFKQYSRFSLYGISE